MEQLHPAVAQMCAVIQKFGGTVMRTMGDGVMALFGIPRALEDHALLACNAAVSMQQAFKGGAYGLAIRVGLHSGLVASDPASHDAMRGGGAHGLAIHVASRVVALAEPGGICLTQQCAALLRTTGRFRRLGPRQLKGVPDPVEILALESMDAAYADGAQASTLSPLRGRVRELRQLEDALRRTEQNDARVVAVEGAPGIGKSRLCHEFAESCRARMIAVYQVRVQPYGHATPLQPILEILRAFLFRIDPQVDSESARETIARLMKELGHTDPAEAALVCEFLGFSDPGTTGAATMLDAKSRRARVLRILTHLIRVRGGTTTVILLEDLHWMDEASEEFIVTLASALHGTRTLLLLNHRSRATSAWEKLSNFEDIELRELSADETEALVRSLISHRGELANVGQLVARRSGGNPFFAEELVRSIAQGSSLAADSENESIAEALPETVQAVIAARIDRLKHERKKLLQICAIIGKEVPPPVLERVAGDDIGAVGDGLADLARLEFVRLPAADEEPISFGHPLIQEVAYAMQLKATRSAIHAMVAEAMESHYASCLDLYAALVGHHYEAAGRMLPAARHIARAARWLGSTDPSTAARQWQLVRKLLEVQPRDNEVDRLRMLASSQIAMMGWREGRPLAEVQPYIDEAKTLAAEVDSRLSQMLLITEGRLLQAAGASADEYVARAREALRLVEPTDFGRLAMVNATLCQAYGRAGLLGSALAANDAASRYMIHIDSFDHEFVGFGVAHWIIAMRGRSLARVGRIDEARSAWTELFATGDNIDPTVEAIPHLGEVEYAWCAADPDLARIQSNRLSDLAAARQVPYLRVLALLCAGVNAAVARDFEQALPLLNGGLSLLRSNSVATEFEPELLATLAECELRCGELDLAQAHVTEALFLARARGARIAECRSLIIQGLILGSVGSAKAEGSFELAEQLIEQTGALAFRLPLQRTLQELAVQ